MADRRSEIMKAAFDLMGRSGLESIHARTVAETLGVNHATIHYYFPHRADLLVGIAGYALEKVRRDRASLGEPATPTDGLENELALVEAYAEGPMGSVLLGLTAAEPSTPELTEPLSELVQGLAEGLDGWHGNAKLRKNSPLESRPLFLAFFLGIVTLKKMRPEAISVEAELDRLYESAFKR
jgi:AcrR family transcriptional regulator